MQIPPSRSWEGDLSECLEKFPRVPASGDAVQQSESRAAGHSWNSRHDGGRKWGSFSLNIFKEAKIKSLLMTKTLHSMSETAYKDIKWWHRHSFNLLSPIKNFKKYFLGLWNYEMWKYRSTRKQTALCELLHLQLFSPELGVWFSFGSSVTLSIPCLLSCQHLCWLSQALECYFLISRAEIKTSYWD